MPRHLDHEALVDPGDIGPDGERQPRDPRLPVGVCFTTTRGRPCAVAYYGGGPETPYRSKRFTFRKWGGREGAQQAAVLWRWRNAPLDKRTCDIARVGEYRPRDLEGRWL